MSHCGCCAQAGKRQEFTGGSEAGEQAGLLQVEKNIALKEIMILDIKEIMIQPD